MATLAGFKVWESTTPLTTAASPLVSGWFDTTGYTTLQVNCTFTNSTGTTTLTVEGSFDGATLDSVMTYGAGITSSNSPAGAQVTVQHTFVRFRVVQATANATATTIFVQSRA
jgi:hypothetical protein